MNITIIGAPAGLGLETVKKGLDRKHSIKTLSRTGIEIEENIWMNVIIGDANKGN